MSLIPFKKQGSLFRSPVNDLDRFHRDMNRLFDMAFSGWGDPEASLLGGQWMPAVDVVDRKDAIIVKADLPGMDKEDIQVTLENNVLSISGEKKVEAEHKEGDALRCERCYGSFHRAFTLPSSVDPNKVEANFKNGVLELKIAKKEEARPRQIKIDLK